MRRYHSCVVAAVPCILICLLLAGYVNLYAQNTKLPVLSEITGDRLVRICNDNLPVAKKHFCIIHGPVKIYFDHAAKSMKSLYDVKDDRQGDTMIFVCFSLAVFLIVLLLLAITFHLLKNSQRLSRKLSEALKNLNVEKEREENANNMKTLFIQNINHEIRTPLNGITGFSRLLAEDCDVLSAAERQEYVALIEKNTNTLLGMVNDILDISEMESGNMTFDLKLCSVNEMCQFAAASARSYAKKGVDIIYRPHEKDYMIMTDGRRTVQVLVNYLTNACKFTVKGSITIDYKIEPDKFVRDYSSIEDKNDNKAEGTQEKSGVIIFSVTDTGRDLPPEKAQMIFRRFAGLDKFALGNGLGLHICALIADGLHAKVKLDTSYTGGSRFLFIHPIR